MKKIILCFLVLLVSGCSVLHKPLTPEYKQSIKNVGIQSLMGDKIRGYMIGTTVFNNNDFESNFSSFKMDDKIEESIRKYFAKSSSLKVISKNDLESSLDETFSKEKDVSGVLSWIFLDPRWTVEDIEKEIAEKFPNLKEEGIDALLMFFPTIQVFPGMSTDSAGGMESYGIAIRSFFLMKTCYVYFASNVFLYDTSQKKVVFHRILNDLAIIDIPKWEDSFDAFPLNVKESVKNHFSDFIDTDIPDFLKRANF